MGGTGGGPQAIAALRREYKRDEARREARRARRMARQDAIRIARSKGVALPDDDAWAFTCAELCSACGLLSFPTRQGSPHRQLPDTAGQPCPYCHKTSKVDLRSQTMARAVRESEVYDGAGAWRGVGRGWVGAGLAGAALTLAVTWVDSTLFRGRFVDPWPPSAWAQILIAALGAAVIGLAVTWTVRAVRRQPALPRRWSMALPRESVSAPPFVGTVSAQGTLIAPLSGRPCVAYEIGVRRDARPDAPLGTWAAIEQHNTPMKVGAHPIPSDCAHLRLPRERFELAHAVLRRNHAQMWLRKRGLELSDGPDVLYETILRAGDAVRLTPAHDVSIVSAAPGA